MSDWETADVADSLYYGWGGSPGQKLIGEVLDVGSGKDLQGNTVPELVLQVTEPTKSFAKGTWTEIQKGSNVTLTCSQSNLKKKVSAIRPAVGDLLAVRLESLFPTARGDAKIFDVRVKRAKAASASKTDVLGFPKGDDLQAEPPF